MKSVTNHNYKVVLLCKTTSIGPMAITREELYAKFPSGDKGGFYYKCLNASMTHYGFTYKLGLNIDMKQFYPAGSCNGGGLYFTTKNMLGLFTSYGTTVAIIELCPDAQFYIDPEQNKAKTDKFIIRKIVPMNEVINSDGSINIDRDELPTSDSGLYYSVVNADYVNQKVMSSRPRIMTYDQLLNYHHENNIDDDQTILIAKLTPQSRISTMPAPFYCKNVDPMFYATNVIVCEKIPYTDANIGELRDANTYIMMLKISRFMDGRTMQTLNDCKEILAYDGMMLRYVANQTKYLCEIAVASNGMALQFVNPINKTKQICDIAIANNVDAAKYV